MKDSEGFTIRCKHARWEVINDDWDHDYMCSADRHISCYGNDQCKHYEPDITGEFMHLGEKGEKE